MKKVLTLVFILVSMAAIGQDLEDTTQKTTWQSFTYDVGNMFKGVGYSYTRPLHWRGQQWQTMGVVAGGTGVLYLFDDQTSKFFRDGRDNVPRFIRDYGEAIGNPENNYTLTAGVYFTGLFTKNDKLRRTGVLLISSASATGLFQQIMKSLAGRARPVSGQSKDTFDPFNASRNYHSFPSSHAMMAFTNAYVIGKQFKNPWVKAGIYTVGLVPGISRVWDGQHWLSDVAFSVTLSIFTVEAIDRYLDTKYDKKYNDQSKLVHWNLTFSPGQLGVIVRF